MQHEAQLARFGGPLVFEDHSTIRILRSLIHVLAAHERERHGPGIIQSRRRNRSTDTATIAILVREAIPIGTCRLQAADQHSASPVGSSRDSCEGSRNYMAEGLILGQFDI